MIPVSDDYAPYADARVCDLLVSFELVDLDAANLAVPSCSGECVLSQLHQTHDRVESIGGKYAALEHNFWALDGSFVLPPDDISGAQTGWRGDAISNTDGTFDAPVFLSFRFPKNVSSVGFTVCFDDAADVYATRFRILVYGQNGTQIHSAIIQNTSARCVIDLPTENYRAVDIEILQTSQPRRRVRIAEVLFGIIQHFTRANTVTATLLHEFSPMALSLPASEFTLTFDNSDLAYNMVNPKGVYAYLQQTQPLTVYFLIGGEKVFMGRYYFATATAEDDAMTAVITAYDRIFWLDKVHFRDGEDGIWTLSEAISALIEESGLDIELVIPEEAAAHAVGKNLPKDCAFREAIRLLSQAARCCSYINRYGQLIFWEPEVWPKPVDTLDYDNMAAVPKIRVSEKINTAELLVRNEYAGTEVIYTASNIGADEIKQIAAFENPVVVDGEAVAEWLLALSQRRLTYGITERGNPAREIGDAAVIYDAYGENRAAIITKQQFTFDGGLSCDTEAWGGNF